MQNHPIKKCSLLVTLFVLIFVTSCGQQKRYVQYRVQQGETMRSIAKKLGVKTKELWRLNPDVGRKPKTNTLLFVPNMKKKKDFRKEKNTSVHKDSIERDILSSGSKPTDRNSTEKGAVDFVFHDVKKGDTIYRLTKMYGVSQEQLLELNPFLSEGLKLGSVIKIKEIVRKQEHAGEEEDTENIYEDVIPEGASAKVGLLLPFRAKLLDTITSQKIFNGKKLTNIVTDFYLGAEIAVDSLRSQGVQIELHVIDTEERNTKIDHIIAEKVLEEMDLIIGPLYSDETKKIADHVTVPVIFPIFSSAQTSFSSSKIIKTSPDKIRDRKASCRERVYAPV